MAKATGWYFTKYILMWMQEDFLKYNRETVWEDHGINHKFQFWV